MEICARLESPSRTQAGIGTAKDANAAKDAQNARNIALSSNHFASRVLLAFLALGVLGGFQVPRPATHEAPPSTHDPRPHVPRPATRDPRGTTPSTTTTTRVADPTSRDQRP